MNTEQILTYIKKQLRYYKQLIESKEAQKDRDLAMYYLGFIDCLNSLGDKLSTENHLKLWVNI